MTMTGCLRLVSIYFILLGTPNIHAYSTLMITIHLISNPLFPGYHTHPP